MHTRGRCFAPVVELADTRRSERRATASRFESGQVHPHAEGGDTMNKPVIFGAHDEKTLAQLNDVASRAERVALMADGHLGGVMSTGGAAAYRGQVSGVGVGAGMTRGN